MHRTVIPLIVLAATLAAGAAGAQSTAWGDDGYISVSVLYEAGTHRSETITVQDINLETARITAAHDPGHRPTYDVMAGRRLKGNFGLGGGFTYATGSADARVTGAIAHPFYFNQPRLLEAATSLQRSDLAVHLHGMWLLPLAERFQVAAFGGPTWFRLSQQTIASVSIRDTYPFDAVSLDDVTRERETGSHLGFTGGLDASYFFSRHVGIHGLAQYAHGTVTIGRAATEAEVEMGGPQVGAGLRIRY